MYKQLPKIADLYFDPDTLILKIQYHKGVIIDEKVVEEVVNSGLEIVPEGSKFGLLINTKDVLYVTREARELTARKATERIIATAIVLSNSIQQQVYNLFITFARPPYPTRVFNNEQKAYQWLVEQIRKAGYIA